MMVIHCVFGIITFLKQLLSNKVAKDKFKICTKKVSKNKQKTHFSENPLRKTSETLENYYSKQLLQILATWKQNIRK